MSQTGRSCINETTPQENYEININFVKDLSYFFTSPSINEKKLAMKIILTAKFNVRRPRIYLFYQNLGIYKIINLATSTRVKG